jgi:hypothetical protein
MLKKIAWSFVLILFAVVLLPQFVYWWGLSNLDQPPKPSESKLTPERELKIWLDGKEVGEPKVQPITAYGYIMNVHCQAKQGLYAEVCMGKYPGLRLASLAVRPQVSDAVHGKGNSIWQVTWAAYAIWATRNWDIHQILATYDEAYGR